MTPRRNYPIVTSCQLDDGSPEPTILGMVKTDNRDAVRWDRTSAARKWPNVQAAPVLWTTFMAWSAYQRTGQTTLKFEDFEAQCAELDLDQGETADPTQQGHESATS